MSILVQKFGGTSVAGLDRMRQVQQKVQAALAQGHKVVVVLSAMSGETNRLLDLARQFSSRPPACEQDVLLSTGEQVSVALFAMLLKDAGIKARSLLGFQMTMHTDSDFGSARISSIDCEKLRAMLDEYDVLVAAGFQGLDPNGRITTLGRGGSDTSAVALAAALNAEGCEIYTDVEGVFTTDPNMCDKARKMPRIAYDEMLEMASMGAKVLQIRSVEFAKKYNVPVHVRSTFSDAPGTWVTKEVPEMEAVLVAGIAYDKNQARCTLRDVQDRPGVAAAIFGPLAEAGVLVDMIVQNTSEDGRTDMTFTISRGDLERTQELIAELNKDLQAREVTFNTQVSKVSVIGVGMRNHSGVASTMFKSLAAENINIHLISTSEIKITCLIDDKYTELAVRTLHDAFGLEKHGAVCS
ncbi:aspartate kinase [Megalodesulfovibrio gigas]|uniref:Aspartokinase n=1 Tax=Megalodesulfovibrio gigas (strain ATCC 19364 / DSM 1382 / NCIMB 9332 / VKM B-1759) TaxID=1121448 RepID=T2GCD6_MEGG1|nr:aspartate kinase [Megalodesulfovibrio gigas]AGW14240.1 putative aspartate kinase [Megalodesulfovibrio gigas DSM 1382 = ATCC 19364]